MSCISTLHEDTYGNRYQEFYARTAPGLINTPFAVLVFVASEVDIWERLGWNRRRIEGDTHEYERVPENGADVYNIRKDDVTNATLSAILGVFGVSVVGLRHC